MVDISEILPEGKIIEQIRKGKIAPQPLIVIDKSREMISDNEIRISIILTNKGNAACKLASLSVRSKHKYKVKTSSANGVASVNTADGSRVDIVAQNIAPEQWGSVDLIYDNPTDVEYLELKVDSNAGYGYKPIFALGFDTIQENEKQSPV